MAGNTVAPTIELRDPLGRVEQFQKSKRLRKLLLYLGEQDPNRILREQEIGIDGLVRRTTIPATDTLVRVLISQLRRTPQEYFAAEGRDESYVLEIPKGNYLPVLRPREMESDTAESLEEMPPPTRAWGGAKRAAVGLWSCWRQPRCSGPPPRRSPGTWRGAARYGRP